MRVTRHKIGFSSRQVFPASHSHWMEEQEDRLASLKEEFNQWSSGVAANESLFKSNVYENPEADELDYRQHRSRLGGLIGTGDRLYLCFVALEKDGVAEQKDIAPFVTFLKAKTDELMHTLCEWHLPADLVDPVPESFKEGMADIAAGKVVDMEKALNEAP